MRVGIFVGRKSPEAGGAFTFEDEMLSSILSAAKLTHHQFVIFSSFPNNFEEFQDGHFETVRIRFVPVRRLCGTLVRTINYFFTEVFQLPHLIRSEEWIDRILFRHRIGFFLNFTPTTVTREVPYLAQMWDLQYRLQPFFPEVSAQGRWSSWDRKYSTLFRRATFVVVPSSAGKSQVEKFYGVPSERIRIVPHPTPRFALAAAADEHPVSLEHLNIPTPYILYPAQFWPHKNHATILRALKVLQEDYSYLPHVVFVGSDWGNLEYVKRLTGELGLTERVHFKGFVSRDELIALYRNAQALVYASMFGPENLPPLEAFALDCPVIAARISSAEQLGDAALIVDETDERAFAAAIHDLYTKPELRESLISKGRKRAQAFTGQDLAQAIFSLLDEFERIRECWSQEERYDNKLRLRRLFSA